MLDGVRKAVHSTAHLAADGEGEAPSEWYPELHGVRSSAAQTRSPVLNPEHKCLSTEHSFLAQTAKLVPKPFSSVFPSSAQ